MESRGKSERAVRQTQIEFHLYLTSLKTYSIYSHSSLITEIAPLYTYNSVGFFVETE